MPATDIFETHAWPPSAPARNAFAITPHNTNELAFVARGIYVGGAGDIAVTTANGHEVTLVAVPAGSVLPIVVRIVKATGTTATNLVGLY